MANRGLVVRSGQTVRRPQRPNSDAIHALLGHLEEAGFDGAPRFLGTDVRGREVLSYIPGEAVTPPYAAWPSYCAVIMRRSPASTPQLTVGRGSHLSPTPAPWSVITTPTSTTSCSEPATPSL